mmetsp:Transcript_5060/g.15341  ORF Transcript_5060/g.15341 Transcript_5060/m.15341 type:complete len:211 (-) Transcript_5060:166-798(-)
MLTPIASFWFLNLQDTALRTSVRNLSNWSSPPDATVSKSQIVSCISSPRCVSSHSPAYPSGRSSPRLSHASFAPASPPFARVTPRGTSLDSGRSLPHKKLQFSTTASSAATPTMIMLNVRYLPLITKWSTTAGSVCVQKLSDSGASYCKAGHSSVNRQSVCSARPPKILSSKLPGLVKPAKVGTLVSETYRGTILTCVTLTGHLKVTSST